MNYPDPASPWCHHDNAGVIDAATYNSSSSNADMFGDYSTDDLFKLVQQGVGGGGQGTLELEHPAVSCFRLSSRFKLPAAAHVPEVRSGPPSEDEMAAWLYAIINGEEHAHDGSGRGRTADGQRAPPKESSDMSMATWATSTDKNEKLPITEGMGTKGLSQFFEKPVLVSETERSDSSERRKTTGGARRSRHGVTHKLTEKRRRHKINERLKTLQRLVPGCDKSSHASTLDQTIRYLKSLQNQVQQAMSVVDAPRPAALYPVVQPQYAPPHGASVAVAPMVPYWPMLPLPHYPAATMTTLAAAATPPVPMITGVKPDQIRLDITDSITYPIFF
ncbi:transcription factor APG-like [Phragmites australis]|uniref:transcription factor APG-like n=1 Tax=Phragmites australis TaxID=29695 RepID=UPI002D76D0F0|nr:transcription factor APG-like [Phragmites australis]